MGTAFCALQTRLHKQIPSYSATVLGRRIMWTDKKHIAEQKEERRRNCTFFVNERWCNSKHSPVQEHAFSPDTQLLAAGIHSYHLPRELSSVILVSVPSGDAGMACDIILALLRLLQEILIMFHFQLPYQIFTSLSTALYRIMKHWIS